MVPGGGIALWCPRFLIRLSIVAKGEKFFSEIILLLRTNVLADLMIKDLLC